MNAKVTLEEKKDFIQWFIKKDEFEGTVGQKFLKLVLRNNRLIENIIFVEKDDAYPRFIQISSFKDNENPMLYKDEVKTFITENPEVMFKKILKNKEEVIYIQLDFKNKDECWKYLSVKEIDMYDPTEENIVEEAEVLLKKFYILSKLDESLDKRDEILFKEMVAEINKEKIKI
jgi:uncharacterized protein YpiB (UPF0302 family)